jgi:hypothetical protein
MTKITAAEPISARVTTHTGGRCFIPDPKILLPPKRRLPRRLPIPDRGPQGMQPKDFPIGKDRHIRDIDLTCPYFLGSKKGSSYPIAIDLKILRIPNLIDFGI